MELEDMIFAFDTRDGRGVTEDHERNFVQTTCAGYAGVEVAAKQSNYGTV